MEQVDCFKRENAKSRACHERVYQDIGIQDERCNKKKFSGNKQREESFEILFIVSVSCFCNKYICLQRYKQQHQKPGQGKWQPEVNDIFFYGKGIGFQNIVSSAGKCRE
jgi:hypothetical protein